MYTPLDIENKKFSKQMLYGYSVEEVDNFLDLIIKDYSEFIKLIRGYERELQSMSEENSKLKGQIRKLQTELEAQESSSNSSNINNVDLLRRISQLEKIVYSKMSNN